MDNFKCVESNSYRDLSIYFRELKAHGPYCAKHDQHTKHAIASGSGGMASEKFWKIDALHEIEFRQGRARYMIICMHWFI